MERTAVIAATLRSAEPEPASQTTFVATKEGAALTPTGPLVTTRRRPRPSTTCWMERQNMTLQ